MTLTSQEFAYVANLVRKDAAIVLESGKEYLVEARLQPLARKAGISTVSEYVSRVQRGSEPDVRRQIVDALTTNETSFFRDGEPFRALTDRLLPELLKSRRANRTIKIWSAACSSGQEPYSLAMVLQDALPIGWTAQILATDISDEMLARSKEGVYTQLEVNRGLPAPMLVRHFERTGAHWRVSAGLRGMVTFKKLNLAALLPPLGQFDLIFIRNVLIYFDLETKRSVLQQVSSLLRPDGWLFLGSAETTIGIDERFERVAAGRASVYRLRSGARAVPANAAVKG